MRTTDGATSGAITSTCEPFDDQQPAVGGREQLLGARAAARDRERVQRGEVDHRQVRGVGAAGRDARRDEQQALERRSCAAERERIGRRVESHLHLRTAVQSKLMTSPRFGHDVPHRSPFGRDLEIVDADVAEVLERVRDRVEGLDAVAGGDVEDALRRVEGERLRQAVAEALDDLQGRRVELEQLAAAGRRPQAAAAVPLQVVHRRVELLRGRERLAAGLVEAVQRATVAAAADDERAVRPLEERQRPDPGEALADRRFRRPRR